ncbi:MAG: hypothetical protein H7A19_12715 [Rhodanobacteraceae bacterium]|nr:hypothetical protein [Xanthomonadales bacterium]MCP5475688.1 hypothetical protein [Rhodanobacteraceae bacterium]
MRMFLLLMSFCLLAPHAAYAQAPGDWVLGKWKGGPYWFPGVVEKRAGDKITIVFDDGTRDTLPRKLVRKYDWRAGSKVECRWSGGSEWYAAKIQNIEKDGSTLNVLYEDGVREKTSTGACRSS